jgi:nucleotide-binding universal stress UspA family protein
MNTTNKQPHALIAVDYSPSAEYVAMQGYEMAHIMGARMSILHVLSDPSSYSLSEYSPIMGFTGYLDIDTWVQENNEQLIAETERFLQHIKAKLEDDSIQILIREGNFASSILETAREQNASFIILGTHSHRWLDGILLGSVAEEILHTSPIPLYIIPTGQPKE